MIVLQLDLVGSTSSMFVNWLMCPPCFSCDISCSDSSLVMNGIRSTKYFDETASESQFVVSSMIVVWPPRFRYLRSWSFFAALDVVSLSRGIVTRFGFAFDLLTISSLKFITMTKPPWAMPWVTSCRKCSSWGCSNGVDCVVSTKQGVLQNWSHSRNVFSRPTPVLPLDTRCSHWSISLFQHETYYPQLFREIDTTRTSWWLRE